MIARRSVIAGGLASGVFARTGLALPGKQQTVFQLGYLTSGSSAMGFGVAEFARRVALSTEGRVRIEGYPNSELGPQDDMVPAVRNGSLDLMFVTGSFLGLLHPAFKVFEVPFLFRDAAHARTVLDGPIGQQALASVAERNVVGLGWGENGFRHLTTSRRSVRTAADLVGMKLRIPPSDAQVAGFKALGVETKTVPINELFATLASGELDGQENPLSTLISVHLQFAQKYLTLTAHCYSPALFIMSKQALDRLSPTDQEAVRDAAVAGGRASREQTEREEAANIERLRTAGMQVVRDFDRASFANAIAAAQPTFDGMFGKERLDAIRNTKAL